MFGQREAILVVMFFGLNLVDASIISGVGGDLHSSAPKWINMFVANTHWWQMFPLLAILFVFITFIMMCGWHNRPIPESNSIVIKNSSTKESQPIQLAKLVEEIVVTDKSKVVNCEESSKISNFQSGINSSFNSDIISDIGKLNVKTSDSVIHASDSMCSYKRIKPKSTQEFLPDKLVSVIPSPDEP